MTVIDVPQSTTTPRSAGRSVGVTTTAYLSGAPAPARAVTLSGSIWYRDWIEQSLNALLALRAGWDGHLASMVTEHAVVSMGEVLRALLTPGSVPPQFVPISNGGVQADWLVAGDSLEVEVGPDGDAFLFGVDADGAVRLEGAADEQTLAAAARRLRRLSERVGTIA